MLARKQPNPQANRDGFCLPALNPYMAGSDQRSQDANIIFRIFCLENPQ